MIHNESFAFGQGRRQDWLHVRTFIQLQFACLVQRPIQLDCAEHVPPEY